MKIFALPSVVLINVIRRKSGFVWFCFVWCGLLIFAHFQANFPPRLASPSTWGNWCQCIMQAAQACTYHCLHWTRFLHGIWYINDLCFHIFRFMFCHQCVQGKPLHPTCWHWGFPMWWLRMVCITPIGLVQFSCRWCLSPWERQQLWSLRGFSKIYIYIYI